MLTGHYPDKPARQKVRLLPKASGWALFFAVGICAGACGPDKATRIDQEVAQRLDVFKKRKTTECRQAMLDEAERAVDSLLLAEAKAALADSLLRAKPVKPLKPAPIPPVDSATVKPIFPDGKSGGN